MKIRIRLLSLHIRKQWAAFAAPLVFLYAFLLPNQLSLLGMKSVTRDTVHNVMLVTAEFWLLFGLWFQLLGFRILSYAPLREVSLAYWKKPQKGIWAALLVGVYLLVTLPWLSRVGIACRNALDALP